MHGFFLCLKASLCSTKDQSALSLEVGFLPPPPPRNENKIDIICFVIVPLGLNQKWHKTTDGCKYTGETEDKTFIHLVSISHGAPAAQVLNIL